MNEKVMESIILDNDFIKKIVDNRNYNQDIVNYHMAYYMEQLKLDKPFKGYKSLQNTSFRIDECNKFWLIDKYEKQKIKDFKKTNLCRSKFCSNCKKVKQATRMAKFIPLLEPYSDKLYHLTLTVPNCNGKDLKKTIKKMYKKFKHLINIVNGHDKILGIDFSKYNYQGALRSFEITFKGDNYHPHFHIALVGDFEEEKHIINKFSYSYGELKRHFSHFEIIIQKIWYLLMNDKRLTKENIEELDEGYSCSLDKFAEGHYAELFKYLTKDIDEDKNPLKYSNFKVLYDSLLNLRQIQGYGCLYNLSDNTDEELEKIEEIYIELVKDLKEKEVPVEVMETPEELLKDTEYTIISRKRIYSYIKSINLG